MKIAIVNSSSFGKIFPDHIKKLEKIGQVDRFEVDQNIDGKSLGQMLKDYQYIIASVTPFFDKEFFENVEYFSEITDRINEIQSNNNYSDEEMDNDLDVSLWRAFVYINLWSYKGYAKAEKILKKVENKGIKNPIWWIRL